MFSYDSLYSLLEATDLAPWLDTLPAQARAAIVDSNSGHMPKWTQALDQLPDVTPDRVQLDRDTIRFGRADQLDASQSASLLASLRDLMPWRKGPFDFFGIHIDTEWRSDWKWNRLKPHLSPLKDRLVLDIGCGSGYHSCRIAGEGARLALGIDPSLLFVMQHFAMRRYMAPATPFHVLPFGIEDLPEKLPHFDTVLSMGVLYHRKSPINHLLELRNYLRPDGELVLETLVVDGPEGYSLLPKNRYAKMRNTWFIPSVPTLEQWMARVGFKNIRTVDINTTTTDEQRGTDWMRFESLPDFLDPADPRKTIEGYPGPQRAIVIANR